MAHMKEEPPTGGKTHLAILYLKMGMGGGRDQWMSQARRFIFSNFLICQEQAFETSQKYKEGKYIIEMSHMVKDNGWD